MAGCSADELAARHPPRDLGRLRAFGVREAARTVPGWAGAHSGDVGVKHLSGGLTNVIYLMTWHKCPEEVADRVVVLRFYGQDVDLYFDREREMAVARYVSEHGFGARVFGGFEAYGGGRLEKFLEGRTLGYLDFHRPEVAAAVAGRMAACHALRGAPGEGDGPSLFRSIRSWFRAAAAEGAGDVAREDGRTFTSGWLLEQCDWLEAKVAAFRSPVVFCHNDLNEGNIIYNEETGACHVIDYEYATPNYRGFDLGNTLCESYIDNGAPTDDFAPVHVERFPTRERALAFLRAYGAAEGDELESLYAEVMWFSLASHLLWCGWACVQSVHSDIEWCFTDYAHARATEYARAREWVEANVPHPGQKR